MDSFNTATLQLAAMGVTVTVSSGDSGVTSASCGCNDDTSSYYSSWLGPSWSGQGYYPSFPATSPYVTAVGGTQGPNQGSAEVTCQSQHGGVITSGGGFSTYYPAPDWQAGIVNNYLGTTTHTPTPGFNPLGRAYPDISLLATDYPVFIAGEQYTLFGTSASSPLFAAFVSLMNGQRLANGLSTVGWLNPTLYSAPSTLYNDITSGHNNCCASGDPDDAECCNAGFQAGTGWDPATGFGSIDFPSLQAMFGTVEDNMPTAAPTTASPSYAPGEPTPVPTAAPSSIAPVRGHVLSLYSSAGCEDLVFPPTSADTGLVMILGQNVGSCIFVHNATGPDSSLMNVLDERNVFLYQYQYRYASTDCTGDPISVVNAGTGYAECQQVDTNLFTVSQLTTELEPWKDPNLPSAVMEIDYESHSTCASIDAKDSNMGSFVWVATGTCIGGLSVYSCDSSAVVDTIPIDDEDVDVTGFFEFLYDDFDCKGGKEKTKVPAAICTNATNDDYADDDNNGFDDDYGADDDDDDDDDDGSFSDDYVYYGYYYSDDGPLVAPVQSSVFCLDKESNSGGSSSSTATDALTQTYGALMWGGVLIGAAVLCVSMYYLKEYFRKSTWTTVTEGGTETAGGGMELAESGVKKSDDDVSAINPMQQSNSNSGVSTTSRTALFASVENNSLI